MKSNRELLLDIIYNRKKHIKLYIEELQNSVNNSDDDKAMVYRNDIESLENDLSFYDEIELCVDTYSNGLDYLKKYIKRCESNDDSSLLRIDKYSILKELLKEYKIEYKKNYWNNKRLGLNGIFDNNLFCEIIKNKINKYVNCNKVTRKKYSHLVVFLNELLHEMENSDSPLKLLKQKMKMYEKYKKTEYIEIRSKKLTKVDILKEILEEYNKKKIKLR